ncbi:MAG: PQQ-dependent sugar dehydrogenase [Phycisphaeraceae bacterium]
MKRTLIHVVAVMACCLVLSVTFLAQAEEPTWDDDRFEIEVLATGMPQPMEVEVAPDGRVFFIELGGKLRAYKPDAKQVIEVGTLNVWAQQENGLLGMALDPKFSENRWIYLQYSPPDYSGQHISRFTLDGDKLDMASEKVLLKFEEQRIECCHHAGSMEFGPDGSLFIATGDNTHPAGDSAGYAPIDERPDRFPWDAQKSSANMNDLRGKVLRIKPTAEGKYEIPDGNLFPKDGSKGRPEIYVMGCRNPWRMNVDPATGYVYWGEVGPDAGGDGERGPRGYDEINQARKAGNFGWPYFVGNNYAYADYDFATKKLGKKYDPLRPVNESPYNTGGKELPPAQPAWIYYPYGDSKEFPALGKGGRTACAGPVFHYDAQFAKTEGFPQSFDNCMIIYDWQRPYVKWARLDKDSNLVAIENFTSKLSFRRPVDFKFAADGTLYMLEYGETWGSNADSKLLRIRYERGNRSPIVKAAATNNIGKAPLTVTLSSEGTVDPDKKDKLIYRWQVTPGDKVIATEANATITLDKPGVYNVHLTVTDPQGATGSATVPVLVGNDPPKIRFDSPRDGDFVSLESSIRYRLRVEDAEDGDSDFDEQAMGERTVLTATLRPPGSPGASGSTAIDPPGLKLMKSSDCFNCHSVDRKIVGPSYLDVAMKYKGDAKALDAAAERVVKGSTGVWGQVPMLPHSQHTLEQTKEMVAWVFSLKVEATVSQTVKGVFGAIPPPRVEEAGSAKGGPTGGVTGGVYVIEATYTDKGAAPVGPLTAHATITLRSRQIEAESADEVRGASLLESPNAGGGKFLGAIHHRNFARLDHLNLATVRRVTCRIASGGAGGHIEFRADKPDGKLLASVEVKPTGGWEAWAEASAAIENPGQPVTLYMVFVNPGKQHIMNLDWVRFDAK